MAKHGKKIDKTQKNTNKLENEQIKEGNNLKNKHQESPQKNDKTHDEMASQNNTENIYQTKGINNNEDKIKETEITKFITKQPNIIESQKNLESLLAYYDSSDEQNDQVKQNIFIENDEKINSQIKNTTSSSESSDDSQNTDHNISSNTKHNENINKNSIEETNQNNSIKDDTKIENHEYNKINDDKNTNTNPNVNKEIYKTNQNYMTNLQNSYNANYNNTPIPLNNMNNTYQTYPNNILYQNYNYSTNFPNNNHLQNYQQNYNSSCNTIYSNPYLHTGTYNSTFPNYAQPINSTYQINVNKNFDKLFNSQYFSKDNKKINAEFKNIPVINQKEILKDWKPTIVEEEKKSKKYDIKTKVYNPANNTFDKVIIHGKNQKRKHQINWLAKEAVEKEYEILQKVNHNKRRTTNDKYGW
ncbi:conserved Plasmodium protein, unknown function [Plasmodium berghei]|uniref:Uncharacterized protein n=2 Tax=Plasmodium berghei TaxID=5821 RepID=A0A509AQR9_PLABA|nr:conserved protein, unknown function [Plasmodium berghei ANKA]CXJ05829.1 conserved Plasmodium protein, unknown function [Plasmodium berghei]SCL98866.1 conserved Plasmodium protein, unknown function [Plasmodium berghei]SCM16919.1 conserved Plasmodium protein, unknown function [Plasmodium berghei]SCM18717.1 conserved Plasmodium protein, unknown function [Plasmodium berghei]SCN28153.1 conserved Plasmodium protein, unknown function [Plasmodium berghei]|eukprot:XP_034423802.1 conserved protein, unknown function [Plasmodium berghei ANKA]